MSSSKASLPGLLRHNRVWIKLVPNRKILRSSSILLFAGMMSPVVQSSQGFPRESLFSARRVLRYHLLNVPFINMGLAKLGGNQETPHNRLCYVKAWVTGVAQDDWVIRSYPLATVGSCQHVGELGYKKYVLAISHTWTYYENSFSFSVLPVVSSLWDETVSCRVFIQNNSNTAILFPVSGRV